MSSAKRPLLFVLGFLAVSFAQDSSLYFPEETETESADASKGAPEHGKREEVVTLDGWPISFRGKLTMDPKETVSVLVISTQDSVYDLPSRYRITYTFPENMTEICRFNETLWFSPAVFYKGLCLERDWMGKCTFPGEKGFQDPQELIDNYDSLKSVIFKTGQQQEQDEIDSSYFLDDPGAKEVHERTIEGIFCYEDRDYWVVFKTSCAKGYDLGVTVSTRFNTFTEELECLGIDIFIVAQEGTYAFLTSRLFWAITVPIGYFVLLFALIYGCGYICDCGPKGNGVQLFKFELSFNFRDSDESDESPASSPRRKRD